MANVLTMIDPAETPRPSLPVVLAALLPVVLASAAAEWVASPWSLLPLLLAPLLALPAVAWGLVMVPASRALVRGVLAQGAFTALLAVWIGALLWWPMRALLETPSLGASLLLSVAGVAALASTWRLWLLPALLVCEPTQGVRVACERSAAFTREPERLLTLLPVGLALLLPVAAALLIAGVLPLALPVRSGLLAAHAVVSIAGAFVQLHALRQLRDVSPPQPVAAVRQHAAEGGGRVAVTLDPDDVLPGVRDAALLDATRAGDIERALALLAAGADPDAAPPAEARDRRPLILLAAQLGDSRLLRALIARGVDIHAAHGGTTPLHAAVRDSYHGRPETVTALLANGADPRAIDADGNTPLHFAALSTDAGVAAMLLDAGADVDALNRAGLAPLAIACRAGNWTLAGFLLEHGARPEVARGEPALVAAAGAADDDVTGVKLLLKRRARVDAVDALGRTALIHAALEGNAAIVAALLDARADVDVQDQRGTTAVMEAARAGADDVLTVLATQHPDVSRRDVHGRDALALACQSPRAGTGTVQILLALGADPHAPADDGRSALDHAASAGRWNLVAVLDPDTPLPASHCGDAAPEPGADSPAHLLDALRFGHWAAVSGFHARVREWPEAERAALFLELADVDHRLARQWLLDHGLDAGACLADGTRLIEAVLQRLPASLDALDDLRRAGASVAGAGFLARVMAGLGDAAAGAALVPSLLDAGADPFGVDDAGRAPLHHAAAHAVVPALQALLARGCDPCVRDADGLAPLHHAMLSEHGDRLRVLQALVRHGADPEAGGANGETPLGLALAAGDAAAAYWLRWSGWLLPGRALRASDVPAAAAVGDEEAVARLIELGFDVDARDARGATALMRAAGGGYVAVAHRLLRHDADVAAVSHGGATALSAAVSARHAELVAALLQHGAMVDQRLDGGATALMVAAALGHAGLAELLLEQGADVNACDERGRGAWHAAAQYCFGSRDSLAGRRILHVLLERGVRVDALDAKGASALVYMLGGFAKPGTAVDATHLGALLPVLLDAGVPLNAADERGVTPLHCCAMHALLAPARLLLGRGAQRDARDQRGRTPADVANLLGYVDVARELDGPVAVPGVSSTLRQPS